MQTINVRITAEAPTETDLLEAVQAALIEVYPTDEPVVPRVELV